jgi:hypothetical protein
MAILVRSVHYLFEDHLALTSRMAWLQAVMASLRVVAADRPPFVFIDSARSGNARFYGLLVDLLPVLLSYGAADGDKTALEYYAVAPSGGELKNGTWTGLDGHAPPSVVQLM